MNKQNQLAEINKSGKAYIIYKSKKGFNLYTDFSKKIILNNKNIKNFLKKRFKNKNRKTDLFIGFFVYELLNSMIDVKIHKEKNIKTAGNIKYYGEKKINDKTDKFLNKKW